MWARDVAESAKRRKTLLARKDRRVSWSLLLMMLYMLHDPKYYATIIPRVDGVMQDL